MTWTFECPSFVRSARMVFWIKNSVEPLVTRDGLPTFPPIFRRLYTSSVTYFWKVRVLIPISFANRALLGLPSLGCASQSATAFCIFWLLEWLMQVSIWFFGGSLAAAHFISVSTIFFRFACSSGVTFMDFHVDFDRWRVSFILSFLEAGGRSSLSRKWIFVTQTLLRRSRFFFLVLQIHSKERIHALQPFLCMLVDGVSICLDFRKEKLRSSLSPKTPHGILRYFLAVNGQRFHRKTDVDKVLVDVGAQRWRIRRPESRFYGSRRRARRVRCITIVIVVTCWIIVDNVGAFILIAQTVPIQFEERNRYRSYVPWNIDRQYVKALFIILRNKTVIYSDRADICDKISRKE